MNKTIKIIIINILLLITVYFTVDIICFVINVNHHGRFYVYKTPITFAKAYLRTYKRMFYDKTNYDITFIKDKGYNTFFRFPINTESNRPPILIMGCSFAVGVDLTPNQSFMGKLALLTNRPVYNRALSARGPNEMLYQLQSDEFYTKVPKPEWLIYVFIPDQLRRTQIPCSVDDMGVYYDDKMEIRRNITPPLIYVLKDRISYHLHDKYVSHLFTIMDNIKNEAKKHWGDDVKFAFIFYDNNMNLNPRLRTFIENDGYIFYALNDLTPIDLMTNEYKVKDKIHPSESAWDILTPIIVEKLDL